MGWANVGFAVFLDEGSMVGGLTVGLGEGVGAADVCRVGNFVGGLFGGRETVGRNVGDLVGATDE